jgi:MscS family membrane protein
MVISLFTKAARVFLIVALVIVLLQNILGVNITSFLAGLGIAGLALSLAAKDSLQNLLGGLTIFFDKPFQVGDVVRFNQSFGTVEDIGLRSTTIRMLNGDVVCQPNMAFVDQKVENVSLRPHIRREMNVTIPYDTPLDKIEEAIEIVKGVLHDDDVVAAGRFRMDDLPPRVSFNEFNDSSLNIRAYYWFHMEGRRDSGWYEYLDHCQKVNLAVFRKLTDAGIEIAFPTRTVFLAGDAKRPLDVGRNGGAHEPREEDAGERGDEAAHAARAPARPSAARGRPLAYDPAVEGADASGADDGGES